VAAHVVVAFHGYSDSAQQFRHLEPFFEAMNWCVLSPELPFHGETIWNGGIFSRQDLVDLVENCLKSAILCEKSAAILGGSFSMLGFSYGARLALCLNQSFGDRLKDIWLFAPEGIAAKWMLLVDYTPNFVRRWLIARLHRPEGLLRLTDSLHKRGLLPRFVYGFTKFHFANSERRSRLFTYWLATDDFLLKDLSVRLRLFPIWLFMGDNDVVLPRQKIECYVKSYKNIDLKLISSEGHQLLNPRVCKYLMSEFGFSSQKAAVLGGSLF
jgi:pimeloyl-ACP methyl ester carboxylesterase